MNTKLIKSLAQIINSLSETEQRELENELRKYQQGKVDNLNDIDNEPFVGMWQDREDLDNSSQWLKNMRQQEWINKDE